MDRKAYDCRESVQTSKGTTIYRERGVIKIVKPDGSESTLTLSNTGAVPGFMARPLRQLGLNPADYRAMGGLAFELRVAARIDKWANEDEAERERIRNLPEVRERGEIERLYHSADKAEYGHGYQDYGLALSLRAQAKAKLEAWREKYPLAAREERNRELEAAAQHEESLASGALTYDADGWLSRSDQENSAKAHRQRAAELRSQIER